MAWSHLDIDKAHLAYIILGGFQCLFMLCSLFVKEKLYIGEASVATLCGVVFGPHAAKLFDPISWGNIDKITLECSRIVLVVQCFAVGVELPKFYMERHWRSVVLLLLPVMTYGWLVTSLFIWWMIPGLSWLESLACAACVTATDPVLASSVVGKGKFARRVPKHLRDLLSAESGCNDGMAFPFIYLSLYIIAYKDKPSEVALHWICITILYECIFGAIYGFIIGYMGRHAVRYAEGKGLIDRESFLVFYFVLALFCAGTGSMLGMDDLLIGFSAGVGFSNDGWFTEKTEESHVSNVIDLLLNLAYFVFLGAIIPWQSFNAPEIGLIPWRLVVISIFVLLFRRIPIMLALKPIIPDIKTWREALFAGHFGPIGVGAIFACILTRAELETHSTQPLDDDQLPKPGEHNALVIQIIWPLTTFLVISSILVHGSSIAVFALGKRINTLTITMSYTQGADEGPSWMSRLPRLSATHSRATSVSRKSSFEESTEKLQLPADGLPPIGIPRNFLRRQREEEDGLESESNSRASSRKPRRRRKLGAGGPISQSAIMPQRRSDLSGLTTETTLTVAGEAEEDEKEEIQQLEPEEREIEAPRRLAESEPELEVFEEAPKLVIEDEEGNVFESTDIRDATPEEHAAIVMAQDRQLHKDISGEFAKSKSRPHEKNEGEEVQNAVGSVLKRLPLQRIKKYIGMSDSGQPGPSDTTAPPVKHRTRQAARAYQFGRTVIVEDEDGEVIKQYSIPPAPKATRDPEALGSSGEPSGRELQQEQQTQQEQQQKPPTRLRLPRMGTWTSMKESEAPLQPKEEDGDSSDEHIRFTVPEYGSHGQEFGGRTMTKDDFLREIQRLDPKSRREILAEADRLPSRTSPHQGAKHQSPSTTRPPQQPRQRRDSGDDGTEQIPPAVLRQQIGLAVPSTTTSRSKHLDPDSGETPAERKRRLAALGVLGDGNCDTPRDSFDQEERRGRPWRQQRDDYGADDADADSEDDGEPRRVKGKVMFADGTRLAKKKDPQDVKVSTLLSPSLKSSGVPTASSASPSAAETQVGSSVAAGSSSGSATASTTENNEQDPSGGDTDDDNNAGKERHHRRHISWGGERGRHL